MAVKPKNLKNLRLREPSTLTPKGETTHYDLCVALLLHPLLSLTHWIFGALPLPYKSSSLVQLMFAVHAAGVSKGRYHNPPNPLNPLNLLNPGPLCGP